MQKPKYDLADYMSIVITMDDGVVVTIGAGWILPPGYPNFSSTWMEFVGSEGALLMDHSHRDIVLNTMSDGVVFPLSTMPGEPVDHVYAGPMERETLDRWSFWREYLGLKPPGYTPPPLRGENN